MKRQSSIGFLLSVTSLTFFILPAAAQSERYPTTEEAQQAVREFRERIIPAARRSRQYGLGERDSRLDIFTNAWSKFDPAAASFLGRWDKGTSDMQIYPSYTKGRVCIILSVLTRGGSGGDTNISFTTGTVQGNQVLIGSGLQGAVSSVYYRESFVRQGNYLGRAGLYKGKLNVNLYTAFSNLLIPLTQLRASDQARKAKIIQQFESAGCTTSLPSNSVVASERNDTIQGSPDGTYFFGQDRNARKMGSYYTIFRKVGDSVTGFEYENNTSNNSCFRGNIKQNTIVITGAAEVKIAPPKSSWEYTTVNNRPLNLSQLFRLAANIAPDYAQRGIQNCVQILARFPDDSKQFTQSPSTFQAYKERGDTKSSNGDKQGAIADYTEAIRLNSSFATAYYNRAIDRVAIGDKQGAIADFKKAAELFGNQGRRGDQQDALNEIAKLGGDRSLIVAANSPSILGETIEPGSKWEVKNLIYNPATSIVVDRYSCRRLKNGSEICSFDIYNLNHANAVLEVYDKQGQLLELRGADAIKNPTSVIGFPVESIEKLYKLSTEGFGLNDPRNTVGSAKTEIRNLVIPNGGHFKITKSGENALRYNQATFAVNLLLDSGLPTVFSSNSSLKVRLLSAIFFKLQQKRVGSLVKDGAFTTLADTAKAFVNGRWIEEENLVALTEIAFKTLEEELPQYALDRAVGDQARRETERLIAKRLTVWIDIAETFAKGGNVFLQWLDWERSRKAAQNALIFPVVK